MENRGQRRPLGIVILAFVFALLGILSFIAAIFLPAAYGELVSKVERCIKAAGLTGMSIPSPLGTVVRALVISGALIALAWGIAQLRPWAWWFAVFIEGLSLLDLLTGSTSLISLRVSGFSALLVFILHAVILGYLVSRRDLFLRSYSEPDIVAP